MCWCSLESIGIHLGENYPRLWLVVGQYKSGARVLTVLVVILQIIRICFVAYEWKFINTEYPQSETIAFCFLSILLGFVSLGLESLLLFAIHKNNIKKIQPWFLCTFLIFLIASLAFVITSTLYIIRPIDHNAHLDLLKSQTPAPSASPTLNDNTTNDVNGTTGTLGGLSRNETTKDTRPIITLSEDPYDYMMEEGVSSTTTTSTEPSLDFDMDSDAECDLKNGTCIKSTDGDKNATTNRIRNRRAINAAAKANTTSAKANNIESFEKISDDDIMAIPSISREVLRNGNGNGNGSDENVSFLSSPAGVCINSNKNASSSAGAESRKGKRGRKTVQYIVRAHNETYAVHPIVPLSYLLDVLRCIPQLFLVNRFVKAEQLHEHLIHPSHSHTSLSALYVKPLPVLV